MNVADAQALARLSGRHYAALLADEVDHLTAELEATRETLHELNAALDATFPELAQQHPAAQSPVRLRIVTADTAAPCDQ